MSGRWTFKVFTESCTETPGALHDTFQAGNSTPLKSKKAKFAVFAENPPKNGVLYTIPSRQGMPLRPEETGSPGCIDF